MLQRFIMKVAPKVIVHPELIGIALAIGAVVAVYSAVEKYTG